MLTGDKLETATCIAKSSRLVSRTQAIHTFRPVCDRAEAHLELNAFRRKGDAALVITGESLEVSLSSLIIPFYTVCTGTCSCDDKCRALCGLWGCKNGPAPFPGRMSYKATKPGLVCLSYLSMLYSCIVVY